MPRAYRRNTSQKPMSKKTPASMHSPTVPAVSGSRAKETYISAVWPIATQAMAKMGWLPVLLSAFFLGLLAGEARPLAESALLLLRFVVIIAATMAATAVITAAVMVAMKD